jgi:hypothetical protein
MLPNKLAQAVKFLNYIWEVSGSNLGQAGDGTWLRIRNIIIYQSFVLVLNVWVLLTGTVRKQLTAYFRQYLGTCLKNLSKVMKNVSE